MKGPEHHARGMAVHAFLAFLPMAAVGTLVHEAGHLAVARSLGYATTLHFGSMSWEGSPAEGGMEDAHALWIALGGPLTNMAVGTVGLLWSWRMVRADAQGNRVRRWLAAILALFWSRQLFNAVVYAWHLAHGEARRTGDEVMIAMHYGLPDASILLGTSVAGAAVCIAVILLLPRIERLPLAIGGMLGSLVGFGLWYGCAGPALLP